MAGLNSLIVSSILIAIVPWKSGEGRRQRLADGTYLILRQVKSGNPAKFVHGGPWEKVLGNVIPAKGLKLPGFKLERPTRLAFGEAGKGQMVAEFKILGTNAANHRLATPAFYRQYRCIVHGESGIEYVEEFWPDSFKQYSDGVFGYIVTGRFQRDSQWLWFRVEEQEREDSHWQTVAEFRIRNLSWPAHQPWMAAPFPVTKTVEGLDFTIGEVTLEMCPREAKNFWNQTVLLPIRVSKNGVTLTNWIANCVRAEDASGNSGYRQSTPTVTNGWLIHRSKHGLDPRYVWKLDIDMEPASDFPAESLHTISLPAAPSGGLVTNLAGVPATISWDTGSWLSVRISTNRTDLALRFVEARNLQGTNRTEWSGSWSQHGFWRSIGLSAANGDMQVTVALVKNVHLQVYVQPRLITRTE